MDLNKFASDFATVIAKEIASKVEAALLNLGGTLIGRGSSEAKRGPGRPKKTEGSASPKRGPGRPKKEEAKRKPGRPKKSENLSKKTAEALKRKAKAKSKPKPSADGTKRGPGRPRKNATSAATISESQVSESNVQESENDTSSSIE